MGVRGTGSNQSSPLSDFTIRDISNNHDRICFSPPTNAIGQVTPIPGQRQKATIVSVTFVLM
jgi:hypothetical protein